MAENDGLVYGLNELKVDGKTIGWLSDAGLQPAGTAASKTEIFAAQVKDGPIKTLKTNAGKKAFSGVLIQLVPQNLVDLIGGEYESQKGYMAPDNWELLNKKVDIKCDSGHTLRIFQADITGDDFANGVNSSNLLGIAFTIEIKKPADGPRWQLFDPGVDPDAGVGG